jgi:hypothetical protein
MRQVRKNHGINGTAARLEAQMTIGTTAQWKLLSCPLSIEDHCGEYCAWYAEETVGGALGVPVQVVVSCQGRPIGALVTADADHG